MSSHQSDVGNIFIKVALLITLNVFVCTKGLDAVLPLLNRGLDIVILGDNDFYSQRDQVITRNQIFILVGCIESCIYI
jgi:phosphomevalonate kinase